MKFISNNKGEGHIDTGVKIIIAVIIGALILGGVYLLFANVIFPKSASEIESMIYTDSPISIRLESGKVSYSYDSIAWNDSMLPGMSPGAVATQMLAIGEGDDKVWLVTTYDSVNTYGQIYISTNGSDWVLRAYDNTGTVIMTQQSSGRVYIDCTDGRQYYTYDGINWTMTSTKRF